MTWRQALPRSPRVPTPRPPPRPMETGRGIPPVGGGPPPSLSSSSNDESTSASGGESPHCSHSRYSVLYCSRCSRHLIFCSLARAARSRSRRCAARPAARARGVGGSDRAVFTVTICGQESSRQTQIRRKNPKKKKKRTHWRGVGEHHKQPEVVITVRHRLEADRVPRPRGRVLLEEALLQ
jgi:hypothetical protein